MIASRPGLVTRRITTPMMLLKVLIPLAILLVTGVIGCSTGFVASTEEETPEAPSVAHFAAGMTAFAANCAVCHGDAGQGHPDWQITNADGTLNPPPLNGDGHTWHHSDGVLYRIVRDGGGIPSQPNFKSGMPAFGDKLSQQEIVDALAYIKSLWEGKSFADASLTELQASRSVNDPFPG